MEQYVGWHHRAQVDLTAGVGEVVPAPVPAAAPERSAAGCAGKKRGRPVADDAAASLQQPAKRRPTRRVSDIPSQGSPSTEEAADTFVAGTGGGDSKEQGLPTSSLGARETSAANSAGPQQKQPAPRAVATKCKQTESRPADDTAAPKETNSNASAGKRQNPATEAIASIPASTPGPLGSQGPPFVSQRRWRQQVHKQHGVIADCAVTQQTGTVSNGKATNGEQRHVRCRPFIQ